jgi:unsaturated chondroitin disaccharide hydrolase
MLTAAATADSRYNKLLGLYPSDWDRKPVANSRPCVVDIMMNLELFFWAAKQTGDSALENRCHSHAIKTYNDFVRADGGTFHVVRYDKETGAIINKGQLQGDVDSSTWSRGQAWMIYGYTIMYRYTKNKQYLQWAMQLADYFIEHSSESHVANWDFQSSIKVSDASATAIVCAALLELYTYCNNKQQQDYYYQQACCMLQALCKPPFFSEGNKTNCLLLHSTQYYHQTENTDVPCTFADYYFMEALYRYQQLRKLNIK